MAKKLLTTLLFFILSLNIYSQEENISKYLDDGGLSNVKYLLKVGYDPLNNEFAGMYEHRIRKWGSFEVGAGIISLKRQTSLCDFGAYSNISTEGMGYNLRAEIKLYPWWGFYEKAYISFAGKLNSLSGVKMLDIIFFSTGFQTPLFDRLTIDFYGGFGVRIYKYGYYPGIIHPDGLDSAFAVPVMIKLGYAF